MPAQMVSGLRTGLQPGDPDGCVTNEGWGDETRNALLSKESNCSCSSGRFKSLGDINTGQYLGHPPVLAPESHHNRMNDVLCMKAMETRVYHEEFWRRSNATASHSSPWVQGHQGRAAAAGRACQAWVAGQRGPDRRREGVGRSLGVAACRQMLEAQQAPGLPLPADDAALHSRLSAASPCLHAGPHCLQSSPRSAPCYRFLFTLSRRESNSIP